MIRVASIGTRNILRPKIAVHSRSIVDLTKARLHGSLNSSSPLKYVQNSQYLVLSSYRNFSASTDDDLDANFGSSEASVQETLDKLFLDSQQQVSSDSMSVVAESVSWDPVWYNIADQAIVALKYVHDFTGLEYGWSIVLLTCAIRVALFPFIIKTQQTASRMAHMQPELQLLRKRFDALGAASYQDQLQFSKNARALYKKYQVNPLFSVLTPIVQLPIIIGMFMGLKKVASIYPEELARGGMLWFPDLTVTDPLYILPVTSCISMIALLELSKGDMVAQNPSFGPTMVNIGRVSTFVMIPIMVNFNSSLLCYWSVTNVITLGQTVFLQNKSVRKYLGIWEPPKPMPGQEVESFRDALVRLGKTIAGKNLSEEQKMAARNASMEARKKARDAERSSADNGISKE